MNPRWRKWIVLAALPAGLVLAEIGVRSLGIQPAPLPKLSGTLTRRVPAEPDLIYENIPDARAVVEYRESVGAEPRRVVMRTNAQRMRGPLVAPDPEPGRPRIACVGDSHTFGYGVPEGQSWPDHLRAIWTQEIGSSVDVINAGVNAYDTRQEVIWYERRVAKFRPDIVVLQYFMNDTAVRGMGGGGAHRDRLVEWTHPRRGGAVAWLRGRWRALDLVCDGIFRRRSLRTYANVRNRLHADDSPGWMCVQDALRRLRDRCRRDGASLVVVLYPFLAKQGDGLRSDEAFAKVLAFCEAESIECHDATAALIAAGGDQLRISEQDYHGDELAHAAFARVVFDALRRRARR